MSASLSALDAGTYGALLWQHYGPQIEALIFAYARIAPVCVLVPLLTEGSLANVFVRQCLILLIAMTLAPSVQSAALQAFASVGDFVWAASAEAVIGLVIGIALALPFWICIGVGELIDNQRGATLSDVLDPAHGVEVSTFSALMSVYCGAAFVANDGLRVMIETLRASYVAIGYAELDHIDWIACVRWLDTLSRDALRLSAPVVGAMFVTEIMLGVLSCFATQMGVFSLAFSIKSFVAFAVFYLYFGRAFPRLFTSLEQLVHVPVLAQ